MRACRQVKNQNLSSWSQNGFFSSPGLFRSTFGLVRQQLVLQQNFPGKADPAEVSGPQICRRDRRRRREAAERRLTRRRRRHLDSTPVGI